MVNMQVLRATGPEDGEWVYVPSEADRAMLRELDGTPRREGWRPPLARLLKSSDRKRLKYSDMPHYSTDVLVLREPAMKALEPLLRPDGEFLPLDCAEAELWLFNCTRVVDALDEERSAIVRFSSSGRIMRVEKYAFRAGPLQGVFAFKVPQLLRSEIFVTAGVAQAAREAGLVRTDFELLWES